jgi:hypothetical protein
MFPYLDFGAAAFVLAAGFGFGMLLGWSLNDSRSKPFFDGDGDELMPLPRGYDVDRSSQALAEVIPFPGRRKAS